MSPRPTGIGAITLFVEDLDAAKLFYREVFGLPVKFENDDSAVFDFGDWPTAASSRLSPASTITRASASARATARPVCEALRAAMRGYGVPKQVFIDNGKMFTARFGRVTRWAAR